jgi:hypothetical protein
MTTKCANPACTRPFLYFRSGKIYLIDALASNEGGSPESARKDIEYFWLCGACSQYMQVTLDRNGAVVVERLEAESRKPVFDAQGAPRKVARAVA